MGVNAFYTHCMVGTEKLELHIKTNAIFVHNLPALVSVRAKMKRSHFCSLAVWITHTHTKAVWNTSREGSAQQHAAQRKYTECRRAII